MLASTHFQDTQPLLKMQQYLSDEMVLNLLHKGITMLMIFIHLES